MAYTKEQWEKAKDYYSCGLTLSEIKIKTGIARNTISQKAKRELWEHGENIDYIEAKQLIAEKKGTKKEHTVLVLDEVAETKIRRANLVYGASEKILQRIQSMADGNKKEVVMKVKEYSKENGSSESLDKIDLDLDASDLKNLADATDKIALTLKVAERFAPKSEMNVLTQVNGDEVKKNIINYYDDLEVIE